MCVTNLHSKKVNIDILSSGVGTGGGGGGGVGVGAGCPNIFAPPMGGPIL